MAVRAKGGVRIEIRGKKPGLSVQILPLFKMDPQDKGRMAAFDGTPYMKSSLYETIVVT